MKNHAAHIAGKHENFSEVSVCKTVGFKSRFEFDTKIPEHFELLGIINVPSFFVSFILHVSMYVSYVQQTICKLHWPAGINVLTLSGTSLLECSNNSLYALVRKETGRVTGWGIS